MERQHDFDEVSVNYSHNDPFLDADDGLSLSPSVSSVSRKPGKWSEDDVIIIILFIFRMKA
jgi:hypothetical protein